jgi:DNA-binding GntR family transcriptional regulator
VTIVQTELAESYGIGITPIREALQRLAFEGWVEAIPRVGFAVTPVTLESVRETLELRLILETASLRMAALRANPEQLQRIQEMAESGFSAGEAASDDRVIEHNREFHYEIALASGNRQLAQVLRNLLDKLDRFLFLKFSNSHDPEYTRKSHMALAKALSERDPDQAERLLKIETDSFRERLLDLLSRHTYGEVNSLDYVSILPDAGVTNSER